MTSDTVPVTRRKVFLSYSRSELYFAEAVVKRLSKDFDVWFDLQRLLPGLDWQAEINKGLEACDALVLITSQAALHSPNVADEWETALKRGVPVLLLVFENVDFAPHTLSPYKKDIPSRTLALDQLKDQSAAIIGCRWRYSHNISRLITTLKTALDDKPTEPGTHPSFPKDTIGLPNPIILTFGQRQLIDVMIPTVMPIPVALTAIALIYNWLMIVLLMFALFNRWWQTVIVGLIVLFLLGQQILGFVSRRFRYASVYWTVGISGLALTFLLGFLGHHTLDRIDLGISTLSYIAMFINKDLLFWAPRGEGPLNLRRGLIRGRRFKSLRASIDKYFVIHISDADKRIKPQIQRVMKRAGFTEGWRVPNESTDIHLCVVSNQSNPADIAALKDTPDTLVCIVNSPLPYPPEADPYEPFKNRQWVDFRSQNVGVLKRMARALLPGLSESDRAFLADELTPQDFRKVLTPKPINNLHQLLLGMGVVFAFVLGQELGVGGLPVGLGVLAVVFYALWFTLLIRTANILIHREERFVTFLRWVFTLLVLTGVLSGVSIITFLFYIKDAAQLSFMILLLVVISLIPLGLWALYLTIVYARRWLPVTSSQVPITSWFRFSTHRPFWMRNLSIVTIACIISYGFFGNVWYRGNPIASDTLLPATPASSLSIQIPDTWMTTNYQDKGTFDLEQFGLDTMDEVPITQIQNQLISHTVLPITNESSFAQVLQRYENPTGENIKYRGMMNLTWSALAYDGDSWDTILLSVWSWQGTEKPSKSISSPDFTLISGNKNHSFYAGPSKWLKCIKIDNPITNTNLNNSFAFEAVCPIDDLNLVVDIIVGNSVVGNNLHGTAYKARPDLQNTFEKVLGSIEEVTTKPAVTF